MTVAIFVQTGAVVLLSAGTVLLLGAAIGMFCEPDSDVPPMTGAAGAGLILAAGLWWVVGMIIS